MILQKENEECLDRKGTFNRKEVDAHWIGIFDSLNVEVKNFKENEQHASFWITF